MSDFIKFRNILHSRLIMLQDTCVLVRANVPRSDMYAAYEENFAPEDNPIFRTNRVHDCNTDKSFLKAIGNIVAIDDNNKMHTLWEVEVPAMYQPSVDALQRLVSSSVITAPMCWHSTKLGEKSNISVSPNSLGETFQHFYGDLQYRYVTDESGPVIDEITSARQTFLRMMTEVRRDSLDTVLELINDGLLQRGEVHRPKLEKIISLHEEYVAIDTRAERIAFSWRMAANNASFLPRYSSAIMVAVLAVNDGSYTLTNIVNMYNKSVVGDSYQVVTAVATSAQIKNTQKFLVENGFIGGLTKRHTKPSDMSINDVIYAAGDVQFKDTNIFDLLAQEAVDRSSEMLKGTPISMDKFISEVVPVAKGIELFMQANMKGNLCNIITQEDASAKSIHPWGNGSTWSYNGDVADAVMERVKEEGGVSDAENCVTLHWDYKDDLDISLRTPTGTVHFGNKRGNGCELDVDMNVQSGSASDNAVENIFFHGAVPTGSYTVIVNNYHRRTSGRGFGLRVSNSEGVTNYKYDDVLANQKSVRCLTFNGIGGKMTDLAVMDNNVVETEGTKQEVWNLTTQTYVPVDMVMLSPNFWEGKRHGHKHTMFMLRDCKNPESVRSFYNEQLIGELQKDRKVMQVVGGRMRVAYSDEQMAGVGFSESKKDATVNLRVKYKDGRTHAFEVKM
jgi:hypothetical protein